MGRSQNLMVLSSLLISTSVPNLTSLIILWNIFVPHNLYNHQKKKKRKLGRLRVHLASRWKWELPNSVTTASRLRTGVNYPSNSWDPTSEKYIVRDLANVSLEDEKYSCKKFLNCVRMKRVSTMYPSNIIYIYNPWKFTQNLFDATNGWHHDSPCYDLYSIMLTIIVIW